MGILDNLENSDLFGDNDQELPFLWPKQGCIPIHIDKELQYEHTPITKTDHMGREDYWKQPDLGL